MAERKSQSQIEEKIKLILDTAEELDYSKLLLVRDAIDEKYRQKANEAREQVIEETKIKFEVGVYQGIPPKPPANSETSNTMSSVDEIPKGEYETVLSDDFNYSSKEAFKKAYDTHGGCYDYAFDTTNGVLQITNKFSEDNRSCINWEDNKHSWVGKIHKRIDGDEYYKVRAEALPKDTRTQPLYGVDYEWEFEFRLAKAYQGEHAVLFQVISPPYSGYDMAIRYVKGNIRAEVRAVQDEPRHIGKVIARADDKTHKYLIRFRRSLGNDGYMQVYLDGTQVFDHRNALTTQSDSNDKSMAKFGIYNGGQRGIDTQAEFIGIWDNLRVRMAVPVVAKSDERAK